MAIAVSLPIIAPSGLEAILVSGGQLVEDTTYYYVVIAFDALDQTPYAASSAQLCYHSPRSEEDSFTTDSTNKSALITWNNVPGAARYNILVSTISGDYTSSSMYGDTAENVGNIIDGSTGYTLTALSTTGYVHHSCQLVNNLPNNIDKDLGILKVELTGADTHDLKDLYDAIVASGFQDYAYYDGVQFTLKGTIECTGSDAGTLSDTKKKITIIRGCISQRNPNYTIQFGSWVNDNYKAHYPSGCVIEILNCRYPITGTESSLKWYGCFITGSNIPSDLAENLATSYYHAGSQLYLTQYIDEIKDSIIAISGRSMADAPITDLKWNESNNWYGGYKVRCLITGHTSTHMWNNTSGNFYDCTFTDSPYFLQAYYDYDAQYNIRLYDCIFTAFENNHPELNCIQYLSPTLDWEFGAQGEFFFWFYNTLKIIAIDENGVVLSGVEISAVDVNGNAATWVENDGTADKIITGTTYTTNRFTNGNGQIDYYLLSFKRNLDPSYSGSSPSLSSQEIASYPYTVTFSKLGYISNSLVINMWKPEDLIVTLKSSYRSNKIFDRKITRLKTT